MSLLGNATIIASPLFPNVPDLPGVPPLARKLGSVALASLPLLSSTVANFLGAGQPSEKWGIIDSSYNFVVLADSVVKMDFDRPMQVSSFPVEQGTFASYNKVHVPYTGNISLAKGGNDSDRAQFFAATNSVEESLESYYIATPEGTFGPITIDRVSYERSASNGATLIVAHMRFTQIRITPPVQYSNATATKSLVPQSSLSSPLTSTGLPNPTGTSSVTSYAMAHDGAVLPSTPSASEATAAAGAAGW